MIWKSLPKNLDDKSLMPPIYFSGIIPDNNLLTRISLTCYLFGCSGNNAPFRINFDSRINEYKQDCNQWKYDTLTSMHLYHRLSRLLKTYTIKLIVLSKSSINAITTSSLERLKKRVVLRWEIRRPSLIFQVSVILATCGRTLWWNEIMTKLELRPKKVIRLFSKSNSERNDRKLTKNTI